MLFVFSFGASWRPLLVCCGMIATPQDLSMFPLNADLRFSQANGGAAPTVCMIFGDDAEGDDNDDNDDDDDFYAWGPE